LRNLVRVRPFDDDALAMLASRAWPGNVRELEACVERLVVFADDDVISARDVERDAKRTRPVEADAAPIESGTLDDHVENAERRAVREALARAHGSRTLAARLLGVSRRTLYNKMVRLGVV
jgi:DNA-binding NtrC family response regulator